MEALTDYVVHQEKPAGYVTAKNAEWLAERIGKDGRLQENELALVRFIKETSPSVHSELKPLLEKVA